MKNILKKNWPKVLEVYKEEGSEKKTIERLIADGLFPPKAANSLRGKLSFFVAGLEIGKRSGNHIDGWTISRSGKYYRAFRKVNGKMVGVYIGKHLDRAPEIIRRKEESLGL